VTKAQKKGTIGKQLIESMREAVQIERGEVAPARVAMYTAAEAGVDAPEGLPLTDQQKMEIDRRLAEHDEDPSSAVPWERVRERLNKKYG